MERIIVLVVLTLFITSCTIDTGTTSISTPTTAMDKFVMESEESEGEPIGINPSFKVEYAGSDVFRVEHLGNAYLTTGTLSVGGSLNTTVVNTTRVDSVNITTVDDNNSFGSGNIGLYNSSCWGFRKGDTGGWILSCDP